MATNGLVVMTPSSVAKTGASSTATINSDGSVTFGSCETLSLNGVFTSAYDNYMVTLRVTNSTGNKTVNYRMRASGSDASGANYTDQYLGADGSVVDANRFTSETAAGLANAYATQRSGSTTYFFGPYLAQPTASRSVDAADYLSAGIRDWACTHSLSTSYDGITISISSATITGLVTVFGFAQ